MTNKEETTEFTFETAFSRLEIILEKMNSNTVSLDESLALYEEADRLITLCSKRLNDAEKRIEILIKNRNGDVQIGQDQKPQVQSYTSQPPSSK